MARPRRTRVSSPSSVPSATGREDAQTSVYCSPDPLDFGVHDDRYLVGTLPIAAPEIIVHKGQHYLASLLPSLKGIRVARLVWVRRPQ